MSTSPASGPVFAGPGSDPEHPGHSATNNMIGNLIKRSLYDPATFIFARAMPRPTRENHDLPRVTKRSTGATVRGKPPVTSHLELLIYVVRVHIPTDQFNGRFVSLELVVFNHT